MLELPPKIDLNTDGIIELMVSQDMAGNLRPIINEYLYWDKVKYKARDCKPEELWACIKLYRRIRSTNLSFGKYHFSFTLTDTMQQLLHEFDLHIGGNLSSNIGISEKDKTKFMVNSIMEEAISSSQIEGAVTTRKKAKEMIRQEKKPRNKSEQMILNNYLTMRHIVEHKEETLTQERMLRIHSLMTAGTLDGKADEGAFRDGDDVYVVNHINSEVVHTPPSHNELDGLMGYLCMFFNQESDPFIHPIIKGCIIHFMIGWLHPFADGNGRTARALFYWYMLKNGYWLTEFLSISRIIQDTKAQYEKAYLYAENDGNDLGYFIHYHLKTMDKAYAALKAYINRKQREVSQAAAFMKLPGVNDRTAQIIKIIYDDGDRVLTAKEIANLFNVSHFTARADLKSLQDLGFLEAVQVNKQKKNYIKSKNFGKLTGQLKN
ncbi:MAG: Fic family protein [Niabella sp.]|nr:Fic family protein [Niabella sp.]